MPRHLIGGLASQAGHVVGIGKMPVAVYHEHRSGQLTDERVARVDSHHQIRREISSPGTRIVEVVLRVQRVIADEAGEDSSLYR